jgi:FO synthase
MTYSRKVFIPLTQLCRDVCHYCTFARRRARLSAPICRRRGAGDRPRGRGGRLQGGAVHARRQAGAALRRGPRGARALGFATTIDYLEHVAGRVLRETGLLPHINAGVLTADDYRAPAPVSARMG